MLDICCCVYKELDLAVLETLSSFTTVDSISLTLYAVVYATNTIDFLYCRTNFRLNVFLPTLFFNYMLY